MYFRLADFPPATLLSLSLSLSQCASAGYTYQLYACGTISSTIAPLPGYTVSRPRSIPYLYPVFRSSFSCPFHFKSSTAKRLRRHKWKDRLFWRLKSRKNSVLSLFQVTWSFVQWTHQVSSSNSLKSEKMWRSYFIVSLILKGQAISEVTREHFWRWVRKFLDTRLKQWELLINYCIEISYFLSYSAFDAGYRLQL